MEEEEKVKKTKKKQEPTDAVVEEKATKTVKKKTVKKKADVQEALIDETTVIKKKKPKKKVVSEVSNEEIQTTNVEVETEETKTVEVVPTKEKKKLTQLEKALICVVVILATLLIICLVNKPKAKMMLSEINESFVDTNASITLINGWYHTSSGEMLSYKDGVMEYKGSIQCVEAEESEITTYLSNLIVSYGATLYEDCSYDCYTINQEYDGQVYDYFFIYEDGILTQLSFVDVETNELKQIVSSLVLE